ncbi:alcohol dehydrogenase [Rhodococcus sp. ACPA4]|uniref:NADPH:quinone oxidoreductase family protein n=1 Tax=Rhodococcus TaxID=1827 RepID=UPI000BB0FEF3|nr:MULTISPECIES: NADPH:quinone oxidoreductase family protein [Rhodococcus]PBC42054.1 alcohol dehydrogenase [Rhodococcus sp. ACPA4]QXW04284.1 NADPH:quinone oxidoreductase family protein [Rhodococcus globerulus]ROZ49279.1 NADPH:quinone oxidoreductase family protein [Rhodococcus sp. WS3]RZL21338.1 MAG: NADPH:quinone oxidoreductase family protein [Rhodococcus sp. (in: high G+C Gram-positive bacteria)]
MRAMVVTELSGPQGLDLEEIPEPDASGKVLIDVKASGVCFPDLLITYGKYQIRPEPPFVPGAEISGVVITAPEESGFTAGDRVLAATYLGGYAERIAVDHSQVLRIPDALDFDEAASLIINYQTMEFALARRAKIVAGETVVVLGAAGGVGTATIQLAKAHGARVIAVVRRAGVEEFLRELGADEVVALAPGWGERVRELTGGKGAQIVVDPVGGDAFDEAVRVLAPEGRLVVIGFAGGGIPEVKLNRVLFRNISIVGAAWGEFTRSDRDAVAEVHASLVRHVENGLRPIVKARYLLEDAALALTDLETGKVLGKAILVQE